MPTEASEAGTYEPTPEEIRAACLEIQAEWTETERLRRGRGAAHAVDPERRCRVHCATLEPSKSWE
ncbi:hypothetical protein [Planctomicrobium sp. SH664]|uniref:hypothetical protein n=1 Tax=Planctomicrobium sp. SH664 TaxID=3448125 RepID=UPI003F5BBA15